MGDETNTKQDEKNAELLNLFISSAVKNLKVPEFSATNLKWNLAERLSNSTFKGLLKHENHPSIAVLLPSEIQIIILIFVSMKLVLKKFKKR